MLSFTETRDAVRRELDGTLERLASLEEGRWTASTRCPGWNVAHLAAHIGDAAGYQGEAFHRMLAGSTEVPPIRETTPGRPEEVLEHVRAGRDHIVSALDRVAPDQEEAPVPLPFATLPCSIAAIVALVEYGTHRNDLDWALGDERPLPLDVATTMIEMLPGFLPMIDTVASDEPLAYRLEASSGTVIVASAGDGWTVTEDTDLPICTIHGDDSAVALFALGRIGAGHPSLKVEGDAEAAARFKHHFPGP